ncbi:MAG: ferrous iron transporter B [Elusimicrobiota bacterium]|jgi:ferrous iron transport protein B
MTLDSPTAQQRLLILAIGGNPNSGKTTLFNRLTGLRHKVGNYAGVTVEKKIGFFSTPNRDIQLIDLPGTYGLTPKSEEERVAAEVLLGLNKEVPRPSGVLCVVDSTCLEKSLYLVLQMVETRIPTLVVLNMADELELRGAVIDTDKLSRLIHAPVLAVSASEGLHLDELQKRIDQWPMDPERYAGGLLPVVPTLAEVVERRQKAREIMDAVMVKPLQRHPADKFDAIAMHRVWGPLLFAAVVMLVFQAIFSWAKPPMNAIDFGFTALGEWTRHVVPSGFWSSLLADGIIDGVGSVVVFLPQILIVFFFVAFLENIGYLPRAALVMDRLLSVVGLQGKSFLPLISSYACAVPGILATRTIENKRDRLATIFVAPFMTCSARLPVYALFISAFIPDKPVLGNFFRLRAVTLLGLYAIGFGAALGTAWVLKSTILKSTGTPFFLEIPPYRFPSIRNIFLLMWDRSKVFLQQAGTVILAVNLLLWLLITFPKKDGVSAVRQSYAGRIGTFMEPVLHPIGFDWKIGVGLLSAQVAREVMISSLATIYRVEGRDSHREGLQSALRKDMTPLSGISLLVFFAFAMQCTSTLAVVRRETGHWKIPLAMFVYMNAFAYAASYAVYHIGKLLF